MTDRIDTTKTRIEAELRACDKRCDEAIQDHIDPPSERGTIPAPPDFDEAVETERMVEFVCKRNERKRTEGRALDLHVPPPREDALLVDEDGWIDVDATFDSMRIADGIVAEMLEPEPPTDRSR